MQIDVQLTALKAIKKELNNLQKETETCVKKAVNDTVQRAPAQVTKAVTEVYGIKSSEVSQAGSIAKRSRQTIGKIKIKGISAEAAQITYQGRRLTPTHFSMTPKTRPEGNRKYTIKATFFKGKKQAIRSDAFLAKTAATGTTEIPFKRTTEKRSPIEAIRTLGIPQMITNQTVQSGIAEKIDDVLMKRIEHYADRLASKK